MTNINDLTEEQLNTLAALGQGWNLDGNGCWEKTGKPLYYCSITKGNTYDPCNNGNQAMELVKRFCLIPSPHTFSDGIITSWKCGRYWPCDHLEPVTSETLEASIVKAFVASKYGTDINYDEVVK